MIKALVAPTCTVLIFLSLLTTPIAAQQPGAWQPTPAVQGHPVTGLVANDSVLVAGMYGAGVSVNQLGTQEWTQYLINDDDNDISGILLFDSTVLIAGTSRGKLFRSDDLGVHWAEILLQEKAHQTIYSLAQVGRAVYAGTDVGILSYDVAAETSGRVTLPTSRYGAPIFCITAVEDGVLAGSRGRIYSRQGNDTFTVSEAFTDMDIVDIHPVRNTVVAATSGDYFYARTIPGNTKWQRRGNEKSSSITYAMLHYRGILYKGSNGRGVIEGDQDSAYGLESAEVLSLCAFGAELFAGTRERGIMKRSLSAEGAGHLFGRALNSSAPFDTGEASHEGKVHLFPNPANATVRIDLSTLRAREAKQITILNIDGRQLVTEEVSPGVLQQEIDVSGLPAGIYRLQVYAPSHRSMTTFLVAH